MAQHQAATVERGAITIFCSHCGQPMRVAMEHVHGSVACPHCSTRLEPSRVQAGTHDAPTAPYPPPPPSRPKVAPGINYPGQPRVNAYGQELSRRNRWVAGALAILLGAFGVHRFYLGYNGWGLTQLLITVLSVFTLSWAVAVWAFIEGILCFVGAMRDIDGRPLSG